MHAGAISSCGLCVARGRPRVRSAQVHVVGAPVEPNGTRLLGGGRELLRGRVLLGVPGGFRGGRHNPFHYGPGQHLGQRKTFEFVSHCCNCLYDSPSPALHAEGRRFEPCTAHHFLPPTHRVPRCQELTKARPHCRVCPLSFAVSRARPSPVIVACFRRNALRECRPALKESDPPPRTHAPP